jgi:hypothetical protein
MKLNMQQLFIQPLERIGLFIFLCFIINTTPLCATVFVYKYAITDTIYPKRPDKLATDPTYPPSTKRTKMLFKSGSLSLLTGIGLFFLIEKYGINLRFFRYVLLLVFDFILIYGGFFAIIWGLIILLKRWMISVNRRRKLDNRPKVKWWAWILLALVFVWFLGMVLVLEV